jgi:hypothetical protein
MAPAMAAVKVVPWRGHRCAGAVWRQRAVPLLREAPVAQPAEAADLKSAQCGFDPHRGHPPCVEAPADFWHW